MFSFLVISDFNAQNLVSLLSNSKGALIRAEGAPFGQVMQTLLAPGPEMWGPAIDAAIIWTSPQAISNGYGNALGYEKIAIEEILAEVVDFGHALTRIPAHVKHIFVPTWAPIHPLESRRGLLDMDAKMGISAALMRMNIRLAEAVEKDSRIRLFDSMRWIATHGERAYDSRLWYLSKTPFSVEVFKEAARDFTAALRGLTGRARKLLIVDLDNTLWGGVVGDVGWQNLHLGGHDPAGEAYRDFQAALKALTRRGVILAIVSKNEERIALEAVRSHPEMILRLDDFAAWRFNWADKAQNLIDLVGELNLGLDAAVLIDDDPAERARVREALPEVLVPEWPANPISYRAALHGLDCFDAASVSAEDRGRTSMYVSDRKRKELLDGAGSLDAWLKTLNLSVNVEELNEANLERTVQLLNKTNQMNLRTRRLSAQELSRWAAEVDNRLWVFRVADKFGDYGLVGIASLTFDRLSRTAHIADFVLSCRVMGRKVEETMLHVLSRCASDCGASCVSAEYAPTPKNVPCRRFFEASGMEKLSGGDRYRWDSSQDYPLPGFVTLGWDKRRRAESLPPSGPLFD